MSRKFISLVVAASIAVAGVTASQAQAADKRTRNVILGAAALAIVGAAIASERRRDKGAHVSTQNTPRPQPNRTRDGHWHGNAYHQHGQGHAHGNHGIKPRPLPGRVALSQLPERCLLKIENRAGTHRIYEKSCLQRHYGYTDRLPNACRQKVRAGGQKIVGYSPRCLHQHSKQARWNH